MINKRFWQAEIILSLAALALTACDSTAAGTNPPAAATPAATPRQEAARAEPTPAAAALQQASPTPQAPPAQTPPPARAQAAAPAADGKEARALEVLRLAREALGGEGRLAEVQSLSASGPFRRAGDGQQQTGELRVDVLAPDKLRSRRR